MTDFLLDTDTSSRLMRAHRTTVRNMRTSGARSIAVSTVTRADLLYGAHLHAGQPNIMIAVRAFLARIDILDWDQDAAEHHALIRIDALQAGRSAGVYDMMIAAHALSSGRTLVTSDRAIAGLSIRGLRLADWVA